MITGIELKQLTDQGKRPKVMVARNHATIYGAIVIDDPYSLPLAISPPGADEILKFNKSPRFLFKLA